jgi:hypothetical protein
MPFGDVGGVEVAYPKAGPKSALLDSPCEIAVEVSYDSGVTWSEPDNARYLRLVRKGDTVETPELRTFSGPAYLWTLSKARVLPEGQLNADGKRAFLTATPGTILRTLIMEAQARGALAGLTMSGWTAAVDSSGAPWAQAITIYYEPGLDYLTILLNLQQQGLIDFTMTGRALKVYNGDTTMAGASGAMLQKGRDLTEAPYTGTLEGLANFAYLAGDNGVSFTRTNGAAVAPWGRWETYIAQGGVSDTGTMTVLTDAALELSGAERVENTYGLEFARAKHLPFRDYGLGKTILVRDGQGVPVALRCRQITLTRDEKGHVAGNVVLNDRFLESEVRLNRRVQGITGGATSDGGSGAVPAPETEDRMPPSPPTGVGATSTSYLDDEGKAWDVATVSWAAPTTNADGTTLIDLDHYEVYYRRTGGGAAWTYIGPATGLTLSSGGFQPGTSYDFMVRAIDGAGNASADSGVGVHIAVNDTTIPAKPSTPTMTPYLGTLLLNWDGKLNGGGALPLDFAKAEFHLSAASGFAPSAATLVDTVTGKGEASTVATGLAYNTAYYCKVVIYDRAGNASVASDQATATATQIAATDMGLNAVGKANLIADVQAALGQLVVDDFTTNEWGSAGLVITPKADAKTGPNVAVATNAVAAYGIQRWAFDPTQLYRLTFRVRKPVADGTATVFYAGVKTYDGAGNIVGINSGNLYCAASARTIPVGSGWTEYVGYLTGGGGAGNVLSGTPTDPQTPSRTIDTTRYIGPLMLLNWSAATGGQVTEVDLVREEAVPVGLVQTANIVDAAIVTAKIADLSVIGAKIANATIGDAKISDLTATKITAGALSAAITVSGRIATALTGARVEMNATGIKAYDAGGVNTVAINNDGTASFKGSITSGSVITGATVQTAASGARYVLSGLSLESYGGFAGETAGGMFTGVDSFSSASYVEIRGGIPSGYAKPAANMTLSRSTITMDADDDVFISGGTSAGGAIHLSSGIQEVMTLSEKGPIIYQLRPIDSGFVGTVASTTSTTFQTYAAGPSIVFVAPASGMVRIDGVVFIKGSINGVSIEAGAFVKAGSTPGSGTFFGSDTFVVTYNDNYIRVTGTSTFSGLTPGATYNITIGYRTTGASTCSISTSKLILTPCP